MKIVSRILLLIGGNEMVKLFFSIYLQRRMEAYFHDFRYRLCC